VIRKGIIRSFISTIWILFKVPLSLSPKIVTIGIANVDKTINSIILPLNESGILLASGTKNRISPKTKVGTNNG
jgi:hypothetical protein